jgi:hypothetical protein
MTKFYISANTCGQVHTRSTASRTYTHCVVVHYATDSAPSVNPAWRHKAGDVIFVTWCGRHDLARSQALANTRPGRVAAILEAKEVDRATYNATRAKER